MNTKRNILYLLIVILIALSICTGCNSAAPATNAEENAAAAPESSNEDTTAPDDAEETVAEDTHADEIKVGIPSDITSLDRSMHNNYVTLTANKMIFDALYWDNWDGTYSPHIATDMVSNEDATEWTVTIRDDVQFADGDPLTAEDVAWTIVLYVESSYVSTSMGGISTAEVLDDTHVLVKCDKPYAAAPAALGVVRVMNKSVYEEVGTDIVATSPPAGIGSGPYVFKEWVPGQSISFTRNENYSFPEKAAGISNVSLIPITDRSAAAIALETGEIDSYISIATTDVEALMAADNIVIKMVPSLNTYWLALNVDETPILQDVRIRQAIGYAINKEDVIEGVFDGYGTVAETIMHNSLIGYDKTFESSGYDPDKARELLAEAGHADDVYIRIDGIDDPIYNAFAVVLQAQLAEVGISSDIVTTERSGFYANVQAPRAYESMECRLTALVRDADFPLSFLTMPIASDGDRSWIVYNNPEYYKMVEDARGELDPEKRTAMYGEIFKFIDENAMIFGVAHDYSIIGYNEALNNVEPAYDVTYEVARWSW